MAVNSILPELFTTPFDEFSNHLSIPENRRILFSGRFGTGKTTFLKWFFDQPNEFEEYNVVRIYPVNYSVANNEDIFKYIKMDILIHLITYTEIKVENIKLSSLDYLPYFVQEHAFAIFDLAASLFLSTKSDTSLSASFFSKLKDIKALFETRKTKTNQDLSDLDKLKSFALSEISREGSIYEFNFISELIVQLLTQWKEQNSGKKTVLVIDDLDRIDPNHIFRLFNVFAAHLDHPTSTELDNKFGFDKIVFVADANNLRNIFHSAYGSNVDFSGYIDKFYSNSVFSFNNNRDIVKLVEKRLSQYECKLDYPTENKGRRRVDLKSVFRYDYMPELSSLIASFVSLGTLSLRNLKPKSFTILHKSLREDWYTSNRQIPFVLKIHCLLEIVGSVEKLKDCLHVAHNELMLRDRPQIFKRLLHEALPLLSSSQHQFQGHQKQLTWHIGETKYDFSIEEQRDYEFYAYAILQDGLQLDELHLNKRSGNSIYEIYYEGIKELQRIGYL